MANAFVHIELNSNDVAKAREFYSKLFDWKLQDMPMGPGVTYTTINTDDDKTGGGMWQNPVGPGSMWLTYVSVDDLEAATAKVKELGGMVAQDITTIPDMGRFAIIIDPSGAAIGLWEAAA